jgi:hypothetical protein
MTRSRWPDIVIALAAIALAIVTVRWADREFLIRELPDRSAHWTARPAWLIRLNHPYRRLQHDIIWVCVAATVAAGAILARDPATWTRRGLSRPGTAAVLVILLAGGVTVADRLLVGRYGLAASNALSYDLRNALDYRIPGAIIGAWVVAWPWWRRRPAWRERMARFVGLLWMANVGLLIAYGLLFT